MKRRIRAAWAIALLVAAACTAVIGAAESANDFHFAILGDRTGEVQTGVYEEVWREIDQRHPDFVINAGDVIQGGNDATADSEWQQARALWRRYKYTLFFTPGNHDIWSPASEKLYEKYTGHPAFYSFNYQQAHFTILDNSRTENLSDDQMNFLERDLEQNRSRAPKFVFFHRPTVWLIPLKFQSGDFGLHQMARKYGVTAVISGHTHQFARIDRDSIVYLSVPSSGGHLRAADNGAAFADGWFYGFVWASVAGSKVDFTIQEIAGPRGSGRTIKPVQ